jgi:thymidylate synthase
MNFKRIAIEAVDIPDAWFQCVDSVLENGNKYIVQQGSYVGQTRLEFDWITILIKKPYREPYDLMLPEIPAHLGIPNPVAKGYIEQYLPYLMTEVVDEKEQYTYGSRIGKVDTGMRTLKKGHWFNINISQRECFIKLLRETPNTNQAVLRICQPSDCLLGDPPCLCLIDMRIKEGELIFYPYFRSWDLWGGFPANLAAIAVLQKYMADEIGVAPGPICASSKGLHIYGYVESLAKLRTGRL